MGTGAAKMVDCRPCSRVLPGPPLRRGPGRGRRRVGDLGVGQHLVRTLGPNVVHGEQRGQQVLLFVCQRSTMAGRTDPTGLPERDPTRSPYYVCCPRATGTKTSRSWYHATRSRFRLLQRPEMVLRWHRNLLTHHHAARSHPRRPGRPRTARSIRLVALRLARESHLGLPSPGRDNQPGIPLVDHEPAGTPTRDRRRNRLDGAVSPT